MLLSSTHMAPEDLVSVAEPVPNVRDPLAPLIPARALAIAVKQREECDWNNWILIGWVNEKDENDPVLFTNRGAVWELGRPY